MGTAEKWKGFVPLPPTIQSALKRLPELFSNTDVLLVYLFGSLAGDDKGHDVDLAILTEKTPPHTFRNELMTFLGTERLDIVDLGRASPAFCFEIIRAGQILYAVDEEMRLQLYLYRCKVRHENIACKDRA